MSKTFHYYCGATSGGMMAFSVHAFDAGHSMQGAVFFFLGFIAAAVSSFHEPAPRRSRW